MALFIRLRVLNRAEYGVKTITVLYRTGVGYVARQEVQAVLMTIIAMHSMQWPVSQFPS